MHPLRTGPLNASEKLGIKTQLKHSGGFSRPGQLGLDGLVGPEAQRAWPIDSDKEVSPAAPFSIFALEGRLVDDGSPRAQCVVSSCDSPLEGYARRDLSDIGSGFLLEASKVLLFMFYAEFGQELEAGV